MIVLRLPYFSFFSVPGTHRTALFIENIHGDGNDRQIRATYTSSDVELLTAECDSEARHTR
jgi:hypothetical protein